MTDNDLGLFRDYGHIIFSAGLILYGLLFSYLQHSYGYDYE
jgi:hypothetical protein